MELLEVELELLLELVLLLLDLLELVVVVPVLVVPVLVVPVLVVPVLVVGVSVADAVYSAIIVIFLSTTVSVVHATLPVPVLKMKPAGSNPS